MNGGCHLLAANHRHRDLHPLLQIIGVDVEILPAAFQQPVAVVLPNQVGTGGPQAFSGRWRVGDAPFLSGVAVADKHVARQHPGGVTWQ